MRATVGRVSCAKIDAASFPLFDFLRFRGGPFSMVPGFVAARGTLCLSFFDKDQRVSLGAGVPRYKSFLPEPREAILGLFAAWVDDLLRSNWKGFRRGG